MARAMVCVACITATPSIGAAQDLPVPVRVEADAPNIVLQQRTSLTSAAVTVSGRTGYGEARSYIDVCVLPCSRSLTRDAFYRVDAAGVPTSSDFLLPPNGGALQVRAGSLGLQIGGAMVLLLSTLSIVTGGTLALLGAISRNDQNLLVPGAIISGVSVAGIVAGILMIRGGNTRVVTSDGQRIAGRRPVGPQWTLNGLVF